jgi:hypothetical protein
MPPPQIQYNHALPQMGQQMGQQMGPQMGPQMVQSIVHQGQIVTGATSSELYSGGVVQYNYATPQMGQSIVHQGQCVTGATSRELFSGRVVQYWPVVEHDGAADATPPRCSIVMLYHKWLRALCIRGSFSQV